MKQLPASQPKRGVAPGVLGWKFVALMFSVMGAASDVANAALVTRELIVTLNAANVETYDLDVDQNGVVDFTLAAAFVGDPAFGDVGFDTVDVPFGSLNGLVIDAVTGDGFPTASLLGLGDSVSSADLFSFGSFDQSNLFFITPFDPPSGNFEGKTGFIGFRFDQGGKTLYGFAQITVNSLTSTTDPLGLTIDFVGYNDVAGASATVTQTPEPGTLALSAIGVLLIVANSWRKRRNDR